MDIDIKTAVEKSNQTVEWLGDIWHNGTWTVRLILLCIVLLVFKSPLPSSLGFPYKLPATYDVYYWSAVGLLFVISLIIEIRRPRVPSNPSVSVLEKNSAIRDLYAFDFDDADIFKQLQRGVILDKVTNAIINPAFKFGILYGESGCGKTSFLKAGLCAALKQNGHYQAIYIKFDKAPPETYLQSALQKALALPVSPPLDSHDLLPLVLSQNNGKGIVFIFDQFEQFFLHQPQPEQRAPFIQLLASWYQTDKPVKILIGIRRDYYSYAMEIAPEISAEFKQINQQQAVKLPNFTVTEATAVFKVLAQTADLAFDESAVEEICRKELAKQDNLILPADIQILASVIRDLPRQDSLGKQGFNRNTFLKVGGVEGLLNNFLKNNLEILPLKKRKTVLKVLRALIDRSRNLRAGELTLEEIQSKASDISLEDIKDALEWSAGTRLIFTIEEEQLHINKYQLTHEKLTPSVLALAGELSDDVEKANTLLERRTNEWLGNQRVKRFLLNFGELRLIDKQRHSLVWGDNQRDKEALIAASQRRCLTNAIVYGVLPVLTVSGYGIWWLSPWGQVHECESYLNVMVNKRDAVDDDKKNAVWKALANSDNELNRYEKNMINKQNLQITSTYQLEPLQKLIVEKIVSEETKANIFEALATTAGLLNDKTLSLAYLTQLQTATEKIGSTENDSTKEWSKARVFEEMAAATVSLGDKVQGLAHLKQLQTAAENIDNKEYKTRVFQALAAAAGSLGDKTLGLAYLTQAQKTAAENGADETDTASLFVDLAAATGSIGDKPQGLVYLTQLQTAAENITNQRRKADVLLALAAAAGSLGDNKQGLAYLTQAQTAAENITDEERKYNAFDEEPTVNVFKVLAATAGSLGDKPQGLVYLTQLQTAAKNIIDKKYKADVFQTLALAAGSLGNNKQGLAYLTQGQTAAENIADEETRVKVLLTLAAAAESLDDKKQGLVYFTQAQTAAGNIADEEARVKVFGILAAAAGALGDKPQGLGYLTQLQTAAEKITDHQHKAVFFLALTAAAGTLDYKPQGLGYLKQARTAAVNIDGEGYKAYVFGILAVATGSLGDKKEGMAYLTQLQTAAENIANKESKANVLLALAVAAGSLGDKKQGMVYLTQARTAAENIPVIPDEQRKADVFKVLAEAAGSLGDKPQGLVFLTELQTATQNIADERYKTQVFQALALAAESLDDKRQGLAYFTLAQTAAENIAAEDVKVVFLGHLAEAAGSLGDKTQGLAYLTQLQTAAEHIAGEETKALFFQALAVAAGKLGDRKQALQFSQHAVDAAKQAKYRDSSVFIENAELNAKEDNYREACNLAHEENVATKDALKILAVVLREYTQKHHL